MDIHHNHKQGNYKPVRFGDPQPNDNWPYPNYPSTPVDPAFGVKNPKLEKRVFIRRDQIWFDLETQIQMVAEMRRNEADVENDKLTNATKKYEMQFVRWIEKHIGIAKGVMIAFVLEQYKTTNMNDIKNKDEEEIDLLMPVWWDDTVFDTLCTTIHDYIVNAVLFEFFTIVLTSKDPVTVDKNSMMLEAKSQIKKLINASKPGFIHRKQNPF